MAVEWDEDNLLASICRPLVSERLSLVHHQLAGKRLLGVNKRLAEARKPGKPRKLKAKAES